MYINPYVTIIRAVHIKLICEGETGYKNKPDL